MHEALAERDAPTSSSLHAVASADHVYAAGSDGVVLRRREGEWAAVLEEGPFGDGNTIRALAATDDDAALWAAGDSGLLAKYDVVADSWTGRRIENVGDTFTAAAVVGEAGDATVVAGDDSGRVHVSLDDGADGSWTADTPGSGTSIASIDVVGDRWYAIDSNGALFTSGDGADWKRQLGSRDVSCYGFVCHDEGGAWMSGDECVFSYDGDSWSGTAEYDGSLYDVDAGGGQTVAVGEDGRVVIRNDEWNVFDAETDEPLRAVCCEDGIVAVGESGTIVEDAAAAEGSEEVDD